MDENSEKRASERRSCNALILFSHFNQIYSYDAKILNYGDGGMCFQCSQCLKPGATVCIRLKENQTFGSLEDKGNGLRSISIAEVKWCTEMPGDESITYGVGVKYQPPDY
jgi:hypothetical protein